MPRLTLFGTIALASLALLGGADPVAPRAVAMRVVPNDNRVADGIRRGDTLALRLVARLGEWHPDGEHAPGAQVAAFAVDGGAPRIPGPLVRVPAGSFVTVTLRNALPGDTLRVHGLHARPLASPADTVPVSLAPGESRTMRFRLDAPGTFFYWGTTMRRAIGFRTGADAQLTGAIVVDPRGAPPARDRVFVLGMWTDTVARANVPRRRVLAVVNGRAWPNTERLSYTLGDTVRWRVINASGDLHPMHLHGFYFRVTARGDGVADAPFAHGTEPLGVTEPVTFGATFAMTWVPEREGNWLYHCHIPEHFGPRASLGLPRANGAVHGTHAAATGMSGMVLGVRVDPARNGGDRLLAATGRPDAPRRHLRLLVRPNVGSTPDVPIYGYAISRDGREPPPDTGARPAPPIVLARGEPVRITVVNRLREPTAVHWHGIELESYFDGVPGFSGAGRRVSPLIAPGDSFDVRFTPPRAGTFIYHTHADEERQQAAGLAGPLIVLETGGASSGDELRLDGAVDRTLVITSPATFEEAGRRVLFDAAAAPAPIELRVGRPLRLRIINMTMRRSGIRVALLRDSVPVPWRVVARDGADIPAAQQTVRATSEIVSIGQTLDVEITPGAPEDLRLTARLGPQANAVLLGVQSLHVRREP